ncbi:MAG: hypothetical protein KGO96_10635 [Elusimicrobia bacterium]|nr:hypothetical protein [Elusimicrobiota bacterium]
MSVVTARPEHEVTYQELADLLKRRADKGISALEVLAIAANMVGKLVAMQDQRSVTPEMAMEVVARNVEVGNQQVITNLASAARRA